MGIDLTGTMAKIAQGDHHLQAFAQAAGRWIERAPFELVIERNGDGTEHYLRFRVREEPPPVLGLNIGDCVHNYRSALDHFVYAAAVAQSGLSPPPADVKLQFPIVRQSKAWLSQAGSKLPGITQTLRDEIAKLQPYHRGDEADVHPLAVLADLDNGDKHRVLHPVLAIGQWSHTEITRIDRGSIVDTEHTLVEPLVDGSQLFRVTLSEPNESIGIRNNSTIVVSLRHRPVKGAEYGGVVAMLEACRDSVKAAVAALTSHV